MNEIPVGIEWPEQSERFARLKESVTLIQQLFREEFVTFEGEYYRTHDATIYDRPDEPVPIYIAASGPAAARLAGRIGDGLICTSGKGPELYTETLLPAVEEGAAKAGRDAGRPWPDDRDEGQLRHLSRAPGDGGHQDLGRAGTPRRAEGRRRGPARDGAAGEDRRGRRPPALARVIRRRRARRADRDVRRVRVRPPGVPLPGETIRKPRSPATRS